MLDEGEAFGMGAAIAPLVALGTLRRRQQPDLLVIADRLDLDAGGAPGQGADRHHAFEPVHRGSPKL